MLDALGPLVRVLAPPLRPTAAGMLSTEERAQLMALVELMLCFGLQYAQVLSVSRSIRQPVHPSVRPSVSQSATQSLPHSWPDAHYPLYSLSLHWSPSE